MTISIIKKILKAPAVGIVPGTFIPPASPWLTPNASNDLKKKKKESISPVDLAQKNDRNLDVSGTSIPPVWQWLPPYVSNDFKKEQEESIPPVNLAQKNNHKIDVSGTSISPVWQQLPLNASNDSKKPKKGSIPPVDLAQKNNHKLSFPRPGGQLSIEADIALAVHGKLTPDGDLATLIYTTYELTGETLRRNFTQALIQYIFHTPNCHKNNACPGQATPEVVSLYPNHDELAVTDIPLTKRYRVPIGIIGDFFQLGFTLEYQKHTIVHRKCWIQGLRRCSRVHSKKRNKKDTAWWGIFENEDAPGIPPRFNTLILLRRESDEPFWAEVDVQGSVNFEQRWRERLDGWRGKKSAEKRGKRVSFDPRLGVEGRMPEPMGVDRCNLKAFYDDLVGGKKFS